MVETNFFGFLKSLGTPNPLAPVIVIHGFNEFLGEMLLQAITHQGEKERNDFNYNRFYLDSEENTTWKDILEEARSSNFFISGRKTIVTMIRDEKKLAIPSQDQALLAAYLQAPNPHTTLILYISLDLAKDDYKQMKKTKLGVFLKLFSTAVVLSVDLDRISESEIKNHIKNHLKEKGIAISPNAIERILEIKGDDFVSIIQQLVKLEIAAAQSQNLDSEDIDDLITGISSHSIWELTDAVESENATAYLNILRYLFIMGVKPSFVIGTLISHYHRIYTAKFLLKHHFPVSEIGKILGQPSFIINRFIQTVRGFSDQKIQRILKLIFQLDLESKTGGEEAARLSLQHFIFQIRQLNRLQA